MSVQLHYDEVLPIVLETISEQLGTTPRLSAETLLLEDLGMDSLERVDLGLALEKKLALVLPDAQVRACASLADLVNIVLQAEQDKNREETV